MAILLAANANFMPASPLQIADPELSAIRWDMGELNDRLANYGYGGVELHWSEVFRHCRELHRATAEEARLLGRSILSAHEGWRGTSNPVPARTCELPRRHLLEQGSLLVRIGSVALFPTGASSLKSLKTLEDKLGRDDPLHYVMFPNQQGSMEADLAKTSIFPNSSIQPTIDVGACWNVQTIGDFVDQLVARGYKATIDSFHISRLGKMVIGNVNWQVLAEELLAQKLVPEIHVAVGRNDFANVDPERYASSVKEMRALIENGDLKDTPLGTLFGLLRAYRWTGIVTIEATMPGLHATFGRLTPNLVHELHSGMTTGVRNALPHITTWDSTVSRPSHM
jgi:hypothetical protein